MFKRRRKVTSGFSKLATGFPRRTAFGEFGGIFQGRILVGHCYEVYEYNVKEDDWVRLHCDEPIHYNRYLAQGCSMKDIFLLCGGQFFGNQVELLRFDSDCLGSPPKVDVSRHEMRCCIETLGFGLMGNNQNPFPQSLTPQIFCRTPLPVNFIVGHSITKVGNNKVFLVGGLVNGIASNYIFQGKLIENRTDVKWKEVESMKLPRFQHIAFKMKEYLYVTGGIDEDTSCEKFNLYENRWVSCRHSLPYPLSYASVVVSQDETFAVITGGRKTRLDASCGIIIFTEVEGFKCLKSDFLRIPRFYHTSMCIPF